MAVHQKSYKASGIVVPSTVKPMIIGLYGVPGSGKTTLLGQLKHKLGENDFTYYEGSEVISHITDGGLPAFLKMDDAEKILQREKAIKIITKNQEENGKVAVLTGHFMFWPEKELTCKSIHTKADLNSYTHILYLDVSPGTVLEWRKKDAVRNREEVSVGHLLKWQDEEKLHLRRLCYENDILFSAVAPSSSGTILNKVTTMLQDFKDHNEITNIDRAKRSLDDAIASGEGQWTKVFALDADKTLATEDTGILFWQKAQKDNPLDQVFSSLMGYSYSAFRQAMLLYEEIATEKKFNEICTSVALEVKIHVDLKGLLRIAKQNSVSAVVITSGLRQVWEKVLDREGLSESVKVIGGGRMADGFVVDKELKGILVDHLKECSQAEVWAFGDSPLDLPMLRQADRAFVVVGPEESRSKTMDAALLKAINEGLVAEQVLLPAHNEHRLDTNTLPKISLTTSEFVHSRLGIPIKAGIFDFIHATEKFTAKLLATPMRDSSVAGPSLREAHRRVGHYLAIEYLPEIIGLEPVAINHVQDRETRGSQLKYERLTTIVALMRGGEPMASGVNDAFPKAMFKHAKEPKELEELHLAGQLTVILVDSVINTGKSIVEFVDRVRELHASIRIVVVAGVVQKDAVAEGSMLRKLAEKGTVHIVALRTSETKFVGSKSTDTGNRLFNTTHLP